MSSLNSQAHWPMYNFTNGKKHVAGLINYLTSVKDVENIPDEKINKLANRYADLECVFWCTILLAPLGEIYSKKWDVVAREIERRAKENPDKWTYS